MSPVETRLNQDWGGGVHVHIFVQYFFFLISTILLILKWSFFVFTKILSGRLLTVNDMKLYVRDSVCSLYLYLSSRCFLHIMYFLS